MEMSSESSQPHATVTPLKIVDVTRGRNPIRHLQGHYTFDDLKTSEPIACDWHFSAETTGLKLKGTLSGTLLQECARCLEPFETPVDLTIEEQYVFESFVALDEREKELQSEDFFEVVDEEGVLDLHDLAHQFLVMEADNHPTCGRETCHFM